MDRGIKDEGFVRHALEIADSDCGRWIANQSVFNGLADSPLAAKAKAALVTATAIYVEKLRLDESLVEEALAISTCGEARAFVDKQMPGVAAVAEG